MSLQKNRFLAVFNSHCTVKITRGYVKASRLLWVEPPLVKCRWVIRWRVQTDKTAFLRIDLTYFFLIKENFSCRRGR